jgi:O-glycosyl hydrolase
MEWFVDGREADEGAILGNSMAWRRRMLFSREAGDNDFSLQRVLI